MQIVFAHYHLNRGGVTQVIVNQIRAVASLPPAQRPTRLGVLYGGRHDGWPRRLWSVEAPLEVELIALPDVDYDDCEFANPQRLAKRVAKVLGGRDFKPHDTLVHVHNHALGKNVSWPGALRLLVEQGYRLLLQVHDFAEDFRPDNYRRLMHAYRCESPRDLAAVLYPSAAAIHYAALTQRDAKLLRATGVGEDQLHLIPNPIGESLELPNDHATGERVRQQLDLPVDSRLVLYPVRGIRRKNLGELLLLAALSDESTWHAVTLAPQNPAELTVFNRWRDLARELKLRCLFDICGTGGIEFADAVAACQAIVTTSVAEGFGMAFLENWLAGKPLVGRDLPEVTSDAAAAGLVLDGLYRRLAIPLDWVDGPIELGETIYNAYQWACHDFGVPVAERDEVVSQLDHLMDDGTIDFAHLPTVLQQRIIRRAAADPTTIREQLCHHNPGLDALISGHVVVAAEQIAHNAQVVRSRYSMTQMSLRLHAIYRRLLSQTAGKLDGPLPGGEQILASLLRLSRLHPLRLES